MTRQTHLSTRLAEVTDRPLVGSFLLNSGHEWVELCANAGLDFVCVDQMVTGIGWSESSVMMRAARGSGAAGWMRLSAYPWAGDSARSLLSRDFLKAIAIGADTILASIDDPADAAALYELQDDEHRRIAAGGHDRTNPTFAVVPSIVPLIESLGALERIEEFAANERCEALMMGIGDLSRLKGMKPNVADERMQQLLADVVAVCKPHGVTVMCPTGYARSDEEVVDRVQIMWDLGIRVTWVPYPTYLAYTFYRGISTGVAARVR